MGTLTLLTYISANLPLLGKRPHIAHERPTGHKNIGNEKRVRHITGNALTSQEATTTATTVATQTQPESAAPKASE